PTPSSPFNAPDLPGGFGYLVVHSPVSATVYVNGRKVGPTNEATRALCGKRFVRLGTPNEPGPPYWVAPGQTVVIPCRGRVEVEAKPAPSPPPHGPRSSGGRTGAASANPRARAPR